MNNEYNDLFNELDEARTRYEMRKAYLESPEYLAKRHAIFEEYHAVIDLFAPNGIEKGYPPQFKEIYFLAMKRRDEKLAELDKRP